MSETMIVKMKTLITIEGVIDLNRSGCIYARICGLLRLSLALTPPLPNLYRITLIRAIVSVWACLIHYLGF